MKLSIIFIAILEVFINYTGKKYSKYLRIPLTKFFQFQKNNFDFTRKVLKSK